MKKNTTIVTIVIIALIAFYGGYTFGKTGASSNRSQFAGRNFNNGNGGVRVRGLGNGGFTGGEVLSKDDQSITIKLRDGGSKIVYYSTSTVVQKAAAGAIGDVIVGGQVTVTGPANSDGSIAAQSIQIRPEGAPGLGGPGGQRR